MDSIQLRIRLIVHKAAVVKAFPILLSDRPQANTLCLRSRVDCPPIIGKQPQQFQRLERPLVPTTHGLRIYTVVHTYPD
jgi:hypothetical protein